MNRIVLLFLVAIGVADVASAADFSFGRPIHLTLEINSTNSIAIGDANGDGRQDLAVTANRVWSEAMPPPERHLALYLQRADGKLAAPILVSTPMEELSNPISFVDLDKDGAQEIVYGVPNTRLVVLRYANGTMTTATHPMSAGCNYFAIGDIDGDANPDVACHDMQATATIFYGNGTGGFRSTLEIQTGAGTWNIDSFKQVSLGDVTGDGRVDMVVTDAGVNSFMVFENNGLGGFWPGAIAYPHPWSPTGVWPATVQVIDLDKDGINEVVTASPENRPDAFLNVYRQDTRGVLRLSERIPIHDSTTALLTYDVDGDGDKEVIAGHFEFHSVSVLGANGAGLQVQRRYDMPGFGNITEKWNEVRWPRMFGTANVLALGDLDGDGCPDMAGAMYAGVVLLYGCEPYVNRIPVSDYDGDGVSDLMWKELDNSRGMFWQWGEIWSYTVCGIYQCPPVVPGPWIGQATGDFDGDGTTDVFWRNTSTGENQMYLTAWYRRPLTTVVNQAWKVVDTGDFDGDDRSDLLWRNFATGANSVWLSANAATPQAMTTVANLAWKVQGVGDFDGDGKSDVFWRNTVSGANVYWRSANSASQQTMTTVVNVKWNVVGVGDFNADGRSDLVWRNTQTGANSIWYSANSATAKTLTSVANFDWYIAGVADYDGDGISDLAWANPKTGANSIWRRGNSATPKPVASVSTTYNVHRILPFRQ